MNYAMSLKLEPTTGADITEVSAEAVRVANLLTLPVEFEANGIHCLIIPGDTAERLTAAYMSALRDSEKYAIVRG
jgi:hypothetical protein